MNDSAKENNLGEDCDEKNSCNSSFSDDSEEEPSLKNNNSKIIKSFNPWSKRNSKTTGDLNKNSDLKLCKIRISKLQVRGLRSSSYFSSTNPYVSISLGTSQRIKSSVKWGQSEASWEKILDFSNTPIEHLDNLQLIVTVFDKERIRRKRVIGSVTVKVSGLGVGERRVESWYALKGGDSSVNNTGEVFFNMAVFNEN
jgi:hypothetical protein